jgi:hypothetical protein
VRLELRHADHPSVRLAEPPDVLAVDRHRAREAWRDGRCRRETSVACRQPDGSLVEGVLDLAFEEAGGWTVVDFKTDAEMAASSGGIAARWALRVGRGESDWKGRDAGADAVVRCRNRLLWAIADGLPFAAIQLLRRAEAR